MTPHERTDHLRAIASKGGQATYRLYGREHMVAIGKRGFDAALERGWGEWLWRTRFSLTYEAVMGRPRSTQRSERTRQGQRVRAQARCLHPRLGGCAWPECTAQAEHRHHEKGVRAPDANEHVVGYCAAHHRQVERDRRRRGRGQGGERANHLLAAREEKESDS